MSETIEPRCYLVANAGNDVNGNPRRCAVVFGLDNGGQVLDVYDHEYRGYPGWVRALPYLGEFHVLVREYRDYLKMAASVAS